MQEQAEEEERLKRQDAIDGEYFDVSLLLLLLLLLFCFVFFAANMTQSSSQP